MLEIIHWNCFKLTETRIFEFKLFLDEFKPDIVSLQEIKLDEEEGNLKMRFDSYSVYYRPRKINPNWGGGVGFLIRNTLQYVELDGLNDNQEILGIKIESEDLCLNLISYYSPPNEIISFETIKFVSNLDDPAIIIGDLNAKTPSVGCKTLDESGKVLDKVLIELDLIIMNDTTHTYHKYNSSYSEILDLVLFSSKLSDRILKFEVLEDYEMGSDHSPITFKLRWDNNIKLNKFKDGKISFNLNNANWVLYKKILVEYSDQLINNPNYYNFDVNTLNEIISKQILEAAEISIPKYKNMFGKSFPKKIVELIHARRLLRKKIKKDKEPTLIRQYNQVTYDIKKSIKQHTSNKWENFLGKLGPYPVSSRLFWNQINKAREQKNLGNIPRLKFKKKVYESDFDKCMLFSQILKGIFNDELDNSDQEHKSRIENEVKNHNFDNTDLQVLDLNEIYKVLNNLKIGKSPGIDQIQNVFLKNLPFNYVKILLHLSNLAISTEPAKEWKLAAVKMIPKKEKKSNNPMDYRPISLTSCLGKVVERALRNRLYKMLEERGVIVKEQSGFRSKRGATDNLVFVTQKISEAISRGKKVCGIFFDIAKAFDKVWHVGLLHKLIKLEIPSYLVNYIKNFLSNRKFTVNLNSSVSEACDIKCGVPQGSVLGPLLFLVYINDIPLAYEKYSNYSVLFADDLGSVFIFKKTRNVSKKINKYLESLVKWLYKWRLKMNTSKCSYTIFSGIGRGQVSFKLLMNKELIPYNKNPMFLGVTFDERLCFNKHFENIKVRATKRLNIIKIFTHSSWHLDKKTLIAIYKSLVSSVFGYSFFIIANISDTNLMALQVIQNFAIRRIFRLNWNYPNRLLYPISNILPLKLRFLQLGCRQLTKAMSHNPLTISLVREYMGSISSINTKGRTSTPLCVFLPIVVLAYALRIFILLVSLIL